jgi:hypothetical protein
VIMQRTARNPGLLGDQFELGLGIAIAGDARERGLDKQCVWTGVQKGPR